MTEQTAGESLISTEAVAEAPPVETPTVEEQTSAPEPQGDVDVMYAGKYKTAEDLEKGYKEVVKKLAEKRPSAPDEYKFDFSEHDTLKDHELNLQDDPTYQSMIPLFKELNLTQEQAQSIVGKYMEDIVASAPNLEQVMADLGPNGQEIVTRVSQYASSNNVPDQFKPVFEELGSSALGIQFAEWVQKGMTRESSIPTDAEKFAPVRSSEELVAEAWAMRNQTPNFDMNKKAQARYEGLMDKAIKLKLGSDT